MLAGKDQAGSSIFGSAITLLLVCALASPWLLMAGGMLLIGARAFSDPQHFGELKVCLYAGLALTATIAWIAFYLGWFRPRRTIIAFTFDGTTLELLTPAGLHKRASDDVASITDLHMRRRRHRLNGWSINYRDGRWHILPVTVTNATELVAQLRASPAT